MPKRKTTKSDVLYPKPSVKLYGGDKPPIDQTLARKLLGWEEEGEEKFGKDFLLKDKQGKKIRCHNNVKNRPLYKANLEKLTQEILNGRWEYNGETIIVGETGLVLNGQHSLIALILACQEWPSQSEEYSHLAFSWKVEPTIDKLVAFGVSEKDKVVNTMDTCKPRSLSDVIYRSKYFSDMQTGDRGKVAKMTEFAVELLWHRTGASLNAFAPRRTHSESLDFIERHPRILACVKHVFEENGKEKRIVSYTSPGYAAGLLFLMACSKTLPEKYKESQDGSVLDFSRYDSACDFWVMLAGSDPKVSAVKKTLVKLASTDRVSRQIRWAVLCKAWNLYIEDKPITEAGLKLKYREDRDGFKHLDELPVVDGIDIGDPNEIDERHIKAPDPNPQEIEERKAKAIAERKTTKKKSAKKKVTEEKAPPKKKKKAQKLQVGSRRWVSSSGKEPWRGRVMELSLTHAELLILSGFLGSGNRETVPLESLSIAQPTVKRAT